jgi:rhodanese-related sulfurtransferase
MGILDMLFGGGAKAAAQLKALYENGAVIVDVRTPEEYQSGSIKGSINIPLHVLPQKAAELKKKNKPVITVCRSGSRSGMAIGVLRQAGIEAYNGGPWNSLERQIA